MCIYLITICKLTYKGRAGQKFLLHVLKMDGHFIIISVIIYQLSKKEEKLRNFVIDFPLKKVNSKNKLFVYLFGIEIFFLVLKFTFRIFKCKYLFKIKIVKGEYEYDFPRVNEKRKHHFDT